MEIGQENEAGEVQMANAHQGEHLVADQQQEQDNVSVAQEDEEENGEGVPRKRSKAHNEMQMRIIKKARVEGKLGHRVIMKKYPDVGFAENGA